MAIHLDAWRRALGRLQDDGELGPEGNTDYLTWDEEESGNMLERVLDGYDRESEMPDYLQAVARSVRQRGRRCQEGPEAVTWSPQPAAARAAEPRRERTKGELPAGGFAKIPNKVVDALMPVMNGLEFKALTYCYRLAGKDGAFFIGYGRLSKAVGSKHRTTGQRIMGRLVRSTLVERTRAGAAGWACHYRMVEIAKVDLEQAKRVLAEAWEPGRQGEV